jgi:hypothetical protein
MMAINADELVRNYQRAKDLYHEQVREAGVRYSFDSNEYKEAISQAQLQFTKAHQEYIKGRRVIKFS